MGTGADRQLRVYRDSGNDLKAVMDYIIEETSVGLDVEQTTSSVQQPGDHKRKKSRLTLTNEYFRF